MTLPELCKEIFKVHGWQPLIEIWVDEFGYQRIAMKYSLDTDPSEAELRTFHEIHNVKAFPTFDEMAEQFCKECCEGLLPGGILR